jgi:hypothetical protein
MKKIFLFIAFAGIVGASSAVSLVKSTKATTISVKQDDKKKKACCKKDSTHNCAQHPKGECHKGANDSIKHDCSKHPKGKKDCCDHKAKPAAAPVVPPAK